MAQALPQYPMVYYSSVEPVAQYPAQYYVPPQAQSLSYAPYGHEHVERLKPDRKRPKYTRSKTGCLVCRRKKVKCDEMKPKCQRCMNGQLDCTWPEAVPKKTVPQRRKSSAISTDTPPPSYVSQRETQPGVRQGTPSLRLPDASLLNVAAQSDRRHSEPHLYAPLPLPSIAGRRHTVADITDGQHSPSSIPSTMSVSATGPSTPSDLLYSTNLTSPGLSENILPPIASSRPSTASSLSQHFIKHMPSHSHGPMLSHSHNHTVPSHPHLFSHSPPNSASRPSTANSILTHPHFTQQQFAGSTQMVTRSPSAYRLSPPQGIDVSAYSRPSTSGSMHARTSPPMGAEGDVWSHHTPIPTPAMQQQALAPADGYYPPSVLSTPQHSRPHSPWML